MTAMTMGIDVGTTRIKAGLVDEAGSLLHVWSAPTPWRTENGGDVVDVAELGDIALHLARLGAEHAAESGQRVAAIGTTGMAETGALLDGSGRPLYPGFAWHHSLGDPARVLAGLGADTFARTTGHSCVLAPSIIKLDYLHGRGHRFRPGQRWLNIPEYVTWRLTAVAAAELSLAGRTGLYDLTQRRWWLEALEFLGAGDWLMPGEPLAAGVPVGTVRSASVHAAAGAVVTTAGHDHPVAALAIGQYRPGDLCLSLGTSEAQIRVVAPTLDADRIVDLVNLGVTVDWHPLGEAWYVLGSLPTGLTLERLALLLGRDGTDARLELSRAALDARPTDGAHLIDVTLDAFSIAGVRSGDRPAGLWRRAAEQLIADSAALTARVSRVIGEPRRQVIVGGWSHDPLIAALRRDLGQVPPPHAPDEPGIVGAALAAARAAGLPNPLPSPSPPEASPHTERAPR